MFLEAESPPVENRCSRRLGHIFQVYQIDSLIFEMLKQGFQRP